MKLSFRHLKFSRCACNGKYLAYAYPCNEHRLLSITENLPVITAHPEDTSVTIRYGNESANFSCEANNGSGDIQYSWFTMTGDGDMVVGATSSELVLTPVTVEMNNTQYYCIATNNSGSAISESALLTVTSKPIMYQ